MTRQTFIVRLDEELARRLRAFLNHEGHGYRSLNELIEVALFNQLNVEEEGERSGSTPVQTAIIGSSLLIRPRQAPSSTLITSSSPTSGALFVLTNRLSPIKVAARALANLALQGPGPVLTEFQGKAARAARDLGLRLRAEDKVAALSGFKRRWIGYPVGDDEQAALNRFIFSFTLLTNSDQQSGPLMVLGLASIVDGRAVLTEDGWNLATAESPLIDGCDGFTLSAAEIEIFRRRLLQAPQELGLIQEFLHLVRESGGKQRRLDDLLTSRHPNWTRGRASAHRSAMIGRLAELGGVEVSGRGPDATVELLPSADAFHLSDEAEKHVG